MIPAADKLRQWREDPSLMVREVFNVTPDAWQDDVLKLFPKSPRLAMKACKGPGKTCVLAWIAWNFLLTRPHPKIPSVSITGVNLADGLWAEMSKWQKKSEMLTVAFQWTKERIFYKAHPETWFMSFRTCPKDANAEQQANTLAGLHADYMLFIIDESGGLPDAVLVAAEAGLSSCIEGHIVQAGNPTHLTGPLYTACTTQRGIWEVIEITSDPDDPKRTPRVSKEWAQIQIDSNGRDNPWVLVNVFGKFPPSSINALLGPDEVSAAMARGCSRADVAGAARIIGVDVARFGLDSSSMARRQGILMLPLLPARNMDSLQGAGWVSHRWADFDGDNSNQTADGCFIDDTGGWGAGWIDQLTGNLNRNPIGVCFAGKADDPRYFNKRTEMHFRLSEWVKKGGCLPNDPELAAELTAHTYTFKGDKLWVCEKDTVKLIIGRSPDKADSCILTFAYDVMPLPRGYGGHSLSSAVERSYAVDSAGSDFYNPLG